MSYLGLGALLLLILVNRAEGLGTTWLPSSSTATWRPTAAAAFVTHVRVATGRQLIRRPIKHNNLHVKERIQFKDGHHHHVLGLLAPYS